MSIFDDAAQALSQAFTPGAKRESRLATKFQTGSFRGAKFFLEQVESEFGRRTVDREYPKRDDPHSEDLGRKQREYTFDAFVLGADYESMRDALIAACDTAGPGALIHPYLGRIDVVCKMCKVRERKDTLGMASFSLTFKEAGKLIYPAASADNATAMANAASAVTAASATDLNNKLGLLSAAGDVLTMAQARVSQVSDLVKGAALSITHKLQAIHDFAYAVKNMKAQVATILATPGMLATQINDTINLLSSILPGHDRNQAIAAFQVLYTTTPTTFQLLDKKAGNAPLSVLPVSTAPDAQAMTSVETAIANHVARCAIAAAAVEAVNNTYASLEAALAMQRQLADQLDAMATAIGSNPSLNDSDDQVYDSLTALRAQIFQSVPPPDQALPELGTYIPQMIVPSLTIAYDLYGDGGSASQYSDDIVARNKIRHPGFVPGLKVLSVLRGLPVSAA